MKARVITKRTLSLVLSLLMIVSTISISFTAGAATCTRDHSDFDNDPTIVWEILREATCGESGKKRTSCPDCHETVTYVIPLDPDAHVIGPWEVVRVGSCTQVGVEERYCVNGCTYEGTSQKIVFDHRESPMHNFTRLYGEDATCVKAGYEFVMCTSCYAMETRTLEIDEDAHKMSEWTITKEATCLDNSGERTRYCLNHDGNGKYCKAIEYDSYTDYDNHTKVTWNEDAKVEATCYSDGYIPGTCDDCGEYLTKVVPQHSQANYKVISSTPATCIAEGVEKRVCLGDSIQGGNAGCGYEYEVVLEITDESPHVIGEWRIEKEASCTPGLRYRQCIYHGSVARTEEEIPANGQHNYGEWVVTLEPDCASTGLKVKTCADCGNKISEELPAKHNYLDWTVITEMNCDETEIQQGVKLAKCNDCNNEKYFYIPAEHNFSLWAIVEEASCKLGKTGKMERTCKGCGLKETKEYTKEHDFCDWYVTLEPVCRKDDLSGREGEYTRYCKTCKLKETKSIPVTHHFTDWEVIEYPVHKVNDAGTISVASGLKRGYCKFCDATTTEVIEVDHIYGEWTVAVKSDCTAEPKVTGYQTRSCVVCGFSQKENLPLHTYGDWYGFADCSNVSGKISRKCTKCDVVQEVTNGDEIYPDSKHPNLKVTVIAPTCTTSGYTINYCPDCDATEYTDVLPSAGHKLDANWTTVGTATCTAEGSKFKACADCDYLEFEYFEKAEHLLIQLEAEVEPGCTTPGRSAKSYCGVCGIVFESKVIEPLGHEFEDGSEICKICKVYYGTECTCACHSVAGMEVIVFKIICKLYQMIGINQYCKCGDMHYDEPGFLAKLFGNA